MCYASMHSNFGKMKLLFFCFAFCIVIVPQGVTGKAKWNPCTALYHYLGDFFEKVRVPLPQHYTVKKAFRYSRP
jgi:hypothetical protein